MRRAEIDGHKYEYIVMDVPFKYLGIKQYHFGAWAIKESMAAIIQEMIDPSSSANHSDIPYNIVKIYCTQNYPNLTHKEIITALYTSLFSLKPGVEFFNNIDSIARCLFSFNNWFNHHISKIQIITSENKALTISDFFRDLSARFLCSLQSLIGIDPKYLAAIMQACQIGHSRFPILELIKKDITPSALENLIKQTGAPVFIGSADT